MIIARGRIVAAGAIDELEGALRAPAPRGGGRRLRRRLARRPRRPRPCSSEAATGCKLLVDEHVDLDALLARAGAAGEVRRFVYEPPQLSELFMEAVAPAAAAAARRWRR